MKAIVIVVTLLLAGCLQGPTGSQGARGPSGVQGETGEQGPKGDSGISALNGARELTYTVPIFSQAPSVSIILPNEVSKGSPLSLPALTCYTNSGYNSSTGKYVWLEVSDGYTASAPYCGMIYDSNTGKFSAVMYNPPSSGLLAFVVVY